MRSSNGKKLASIVAISLGLTFVISPVFAKSVAGGMTKSVIVTGEKSAAQSFGENVEQSNLIVLGEYKTDGKITVRSVLKGNQSWVGKTLSLPEPIRMGCRSAPVPTIKNAAVLLRLKTDSSKEIESAIAIFDTPDEISCLKYLVPIYSDKSERNRLVALSKFFTEHEAFDAKDFEGDPRPIFKKEFFWAIKQMRDPANFELVKSVYFKPSLDTKDRLVLQEWFAETRDNRAVPILIDTLNSKDSSLARSAASHLIWYYPCPATDAAMSKIANSAPKDMRPSIAKYLLGRGVKTTGAADALPPPTPFQQAEELRQKGKSKEAAKVFQSILESKEQNGYIVRAAALATLPYVDSNSKEKILKSRIAWFTHDAATGNYLEATDTAEILRQLHSTECVDGLIALLSRREAVFAKANKIATMAILELGLDARRKAAKALLNEIRTTLSSSNNSDEQIRLLLEFAWIKQPGDYEKASKLIAGKPNWSSSWVTTEPLVKGLDTSNESSFLIQQLKQKTALNSVLIDWIVYRLGDLREVRATDAILELFTSPSYSPATISDALIRIGGPKLIEKIEAIALNSKSSYQGPAIEILTNCQKDKALPTLRHVLKTGSLEGKVRSLAGISRYGNCDDRKILIPMADYWTGDRSIHYWSMQALTEIQTRCHCK